MKKLIVVALVVGAILLMTTSHGLGCSRADYRGEPLRHRDTPPGYRNIPSVILAGLITGASPFSEFLAFLLVSGALR